jgi:hypothetical protein
MKRHTPRSHRNAGATLLALSLFAVPPSRAATDEAGLHPNRSRLFHDEDLIFYEPHTGDRFAWAVATGDFDGDGADDLATGIPFHDGISGFSPADVGAVVVRYGSLGGGLETDLAENILSQTATGTPDPAEEGDHFGWALAACDFNGDGYDDLAVGIPHEDHLGEADAGAFQLHYGGAAGLPLDGDVFYTQSSAGIPGEVEGEDRTGIALACGDFDGDGFADLAVGVPHEFIEDFDTVSDDAGMVIFVPGGAVFLDHARASVVDQEASWVPDSSQSGDRFGAALATGDFDGDGFDDIAIGVPGELAFDPFRDSVGAVQIIYGGFFGPTEAGVFFKEDRLGGAIEAGDQLGEALAVADFDGDLRDDLAVGIPFEDLDGKGDVGAVGIAFGSNAGLAFARTTLVEQQDILGFGFNEVGDIFGLALAAGDFDSDTVGDLAVGHPGESGAGPNEGAVTVVMGLDGVGLHPPDHLRIETGRFGFPGQAFSPHKSFGRALAVGDFDGDTFDDLAIGVPFVDDFSLGLADVGMEMVVYARQNLLRDGFEGGSPSQWSAKAP